jgi:ubiquinone/menaquinone biosynthesis C-methylase UbiE
MLLSAIVGLGFLMREGTGETSRFRLTPEADAFLVEGRPGYHGAFVQLSSRHLAESWKNLTECVRAGAPVTRLENPEEGAAFWGELVGAIFPLSYPAASRVAAELRQIYPGKSLRLLDVGAGSGVWSIPTAQSDPAARVVAFDLPSTLEHTRRFTERLGVAGQYEYRAGDFREDSLGEAEFDAAVLGHICHGEGVEHSRRLLARVARALKPGGTIVIGDFLPDENRTGPPFPLLFALMMLVGTTEGDTFTFSEYATWLREAGFRDARLLEVPAPSPVVLATRAS